jgi:hypothetical protein
MSNIVGSETRIVRGNDVQVPITCCVDAVRRQDRYERLWKAHEDIEQLMRPTYHGHLEVVYMSGHLPWKFCPICGDRLVGT